jgi:hypothetical protein
MIFKSTGTVDIGENQPEVFLHIQLPMQSVPITTYVVSSDPTQTIQHYVIKFISDLRQVCSLLILLDLYHSVFLYIH